MDTSVFIAKMLGVVYIVIGIGIFLNPNHYRSLMSEMMSSATTKYFGGVIALVFGMLVVQFHNIWEGWMMLVTLVGWMALIKGVVLLAMPKSMEGMVRFWEGRMQMAAAITMILGLIFAYYGFMAV